jgi:hypothetical protein
MMHRREIDGGHTLPKLFEHLWSIAPSPRGDEKAPPVTFQIDPCARLEFSDGLPKMPPEYLDTSTTLHKRPQIDTA